MAGMTFGTYSRNLLPAWIGDYLSREHMLPGGAMVEPTAFTETDGVRFIPSGTLVGRTIAERDAGDAFGPYTAGDDEVYLLIYDVTDANQNPEAELYRHGSLVKENFLPDGVDMATVRSLYTTTIGVQ